MEFGGKKPHNTLRKNKTNNTRKTSKNMSKNMSKNNNMNTKKYSKPYILEIGKISTERDKELLRHPEKLISNEKQLEFSPLSGSELAYEPGKWTNNNKIKSGNNCLSYALGKIRFGSEGKPQPGYASGHGELQNADYKCDKFYDRVKQDSPATYLEKFDEPCAKGFYKIFLTINSKGEDYHWYRQDKNGYFSHKRGSSDVYDVDASGEKIKNPVTANRNYTKNGSLNYDTPCFFACVYSDLTRAVTQIYNENEY